MKENSKKDEKKLKAYKRLNSMPFHLRIQEKEMEIQLKQTEATQKWTMEKILKKDKGKLPKDWKDDFYLFWAGFLKGEYKSINQYLKRRNFKNG